MPFYTIIILASLAIGLAMWFASPISLISYIIGIALGVTLILAVVRKLGKKAQTSLFASRLFQKLTKYKATIYHIHSQQSQSASTIVYSTAHEYADLLDILKGQMKFPSPTAKEATRYAIKTAEGKPFEEKIRVALQYLGGSGENGTTRS